VCQMREGRWDCRTVDIARELDVDVVPCERGRASQMNGGAKLATGEVVTSLLGDLNGRIRAMEAQWSLVHPSRSIK
jgi:hypothetical protein